MRAKHYNQDMFPTVTVIKLAGKCIPPMVCRLVIRGANRLGKPTHQYELSCDSCGHMFSKGEHYVAKHYNEVYCTGCTDWEYQLPKRKQIQDPHGKKQALIELAKTGSPKPMWVDRRCGKFTKRQLAAALANYTSAAGASYDEEFHETMRQIRPEWFHKIEKVATR